MILSCGLSLPVHSGGRLEVLEADPLLERGGSVLYRARLRDRDGEIEIPLIVVGETILCPADWSSGPQARTLEHVAGLDWIAMTTGERCRMAYGWPYLSPWSRGPDERGSSYGQ